MKFFSHAGCWWWFGNADEITSWKQRDCMVSLTSLLQEEIGRWAQKGASSQETAFHASKPTTPEGGNNQP